MENVNEINSNLFFIAGIIILVMVITQVITIYLYKKAVKRNKELSRVINEQANEMKDSLDEKQEVINAVVEQRENLKAHIKHIEKNVFSIAPYEQIVKEIKEYYNTQIKQ